MLIVHALFAADASFVMCFMYITWPNACGRHLLMNRSHTSLTGA